MQAAYYGAMHHQIRTARTEELEPETLAEIRALLDASFDASRVGGFDEHDWHHTLGGHHVLSFEGGKLW
jgi:aminoglycoside 2'-N-acetyltransferase I